MQYKEIVHPPCSCCVRSQLQAQNSFQDPSRLRRRSTGTAACLLCDAAKDVPAQLQCTGLPAHCCGVRRACTPCQPAFTAVAVPQLPADSASALLRRLTSRLPGGWLTGHAGARVLGPHHGPSALYCPTAGDRSRWGGPQGSRCAAHVRRQWRVTAPVSNQASAFG